LQADKYQHDNNKKNKINIFPQNTKYGGDSYDYNDGDDDDGDDDDDDDAAAADDDDDDADAK